MHHLSFYCECAVTLRCAYLDVAWGWASFDGISQQETRYNYVKYDSLPLAQTIPDISERVSAIL